MLDSDKEALINGSATIPYKIIVNPNGVPKEYTEVEYIGVGETAGAYIDTGIIGTGNSRVVIDFETKWKESKMLFGSRQLSTTTQPAKAFCMVVYSTQFRSDYNNEQKDIKVTSTDGRWQIDKNKNKTTIKNDENMYEYTSTTNTNFTTNYTIYIFANNDNGKITSPISDTKLYSCKIYDNDKLVRNFIPCLNKANKPGLYDTVENKFYENKGTGEFTYGEKLDKPNREELTEYDIVSTTYEDYRYVDTDSLVVGQFVARAFNGELKNIDKRFEIEDTEIEVQMGVKTGYDSKNLFSTEFESGSINNNGEPTVNNNIIRTKDFIKIKPNTEYIISNNGVGIGINVYEYDNNKNFIDILTGETILANDSFVTSDNAYYIKFTRRQYDIVNFQLEEGNQITEYVPHSHSTTNYYSLGNFLITKPTDDDVKDKTSFQSMDYTKKFNKEFNPDLVKFPCTALELAENVCNQCGVELATKDFVNNDFVVENNQYTEQESCREVMKDIGKLAYSWVRIGWDNKCYIDYEVIKNNVKEFQIDGAYEQETSEQSKNLYNYKDVYYSNANIKVDEDDWFTINIDNTNGSNVEYARYVVNPLSVKENTQYNLIIEIKENNSNGGNILFSSTDDIVQFSKTSNIYIPSLESNTKYQYAITSKENFDNVTQGLYVYASIGVGVKSSITFRVSVLEDLSVTPDTFQYEPFIPDSPSPDYPSDIEVVETYNLFDKNNVVTGFLTAEGNVSTSSGLFSVSDYINIEHISTITISGNNGNAEINCFYDKNKKFVSIANMGTYKERTFSVPNNAVYIRCTVRKECLDIYQVEKGNTVTEYLPYQSIGIKQTGKNLFRIVTGVSQGITCTYDEDKQCYVLNGTSTSVASFRSVIPEIIGEYTISYTVKELPNPSTVFIRTRDIESVIIDSLTIYDSLKRSITSTKKFFYVDINVATDVTLNNFEIYPQLEKGNIATEYEPYQEEIYPINIKDNFVGALPNGTKDYVKSDGKKYWLEKHICKIVLTGDEPFELAGADTGAGRFHIRYDTTLNKGKLSKTDSAICTHFFNGPNPNNMASWGIYSIRTDGYLIFFDKDSHFNSVDDFKTWLKEQYNNGNPVTIYYELATPEIIDLGEQPDIRLFENDDNNFSVLANIPTTITTNNFLTDFEKISTDNYYDLESQSKVYGEVNRVIVGMKDVEGENVYIEDEESVKKYGATELKVYDNLLTYTPEKRQQVINAAKRLFGLRYVPLETNTTGHPWLLGNELVEVTTLNNQKYITYPFDRTIEYAGHIKTKLTSKADTKTETEYKNKATMENEIRRTRIVVDKANQTITSVVERTDENEKKITEVVESLDGVKTTVSSVQKEVETTNKNLETTNKNLEKTNENVTALGNKIDGVSANFNDFKDNEYIKSIQNLQDQIDGSIQFWNGAEIPTINNYPASDWKTEADKNNHRADIYTVIEDVGGELKQGKSYRFDKVGNTWQWIELTDNELSAVQALAQQALDNAKANSDNITTLTTKTSELEQTDSDITATLTSLTNKTTGIDEQLNNMYTREQVEQLVLNAQTGVTNTFSEAGGNNIFRNTGLWFENTDKDSSTNPYEFWTGKVVKKSNTNAQNMTSLLLQNATLTQDQDVSNGNYTVSFKYKKLIASATVKVSINGKEYTLDSTTDKEFVTGNDNIQELNVSTRHIVLSFISNTNNSCEIYDLMVNAGSVKLAYSQNQNETTTDTVNISKGITITSTDTNTVFKANANGIKTLDRSGNTLTEFTDTGMTTEKMIVKDTSRIVGVLVQEVNNQTWFTRL